MALKVADRVKQLTNTTGSGTLTLSSTPAGFQSFGSTLSNSDTTYYVLVENDKFEIGVGTYSSHSLARSHILQSSNSDNKINLGGSGTVFIGYPADKSVYQNEESQVVVGASGIIFNGSTVFKDVKLLELNDIDSSGTPTSTHLMSFNMTNNGLTIGDQTGWSNANTLIGHQAGNALTTGNESTMVGYQAGYKNQVGNNNTFIGHQAGPTHPSVGTTIYNSTALGYQAGNKMGINNTAIGYQSALSTNSTGFVSVGASTGSGLGSDAVAVGRSAGHDLNEQYAIAIGYQAGYQGGGVSSAWLGHAAGHSSDGATRSIGLGYQAGKSSTGDDCIYLGNSAGQSNTTDDYVFIANAAPASNGTLIKGDMTNKRIAVGKADITLDSTLHVGINSATHIGLIVKSASAQSADLTQWQNAAGSSVAAMAKSGVLTVNGLYASGAGVQIASATPAVTTNAIYNVGGTLYFNGTAVSVGASDTATYASGQALSLTYASGLTATNASNITTITSTANYASGQALSLTYASGLTATNATNITSTTNVANYASGQSLSLSHASGIATSLVNSSGIATYASGQALSLTHASGLTATNATNITSVTSTANYASGQVLSLATASGVATYASGVVRGGVAKFNKVGINTDTSPYGIQVVGAGASGLIEATGVLVGNSGVVLANNTPGITTNTLYNVGGDLYFNGSQLASGGGASATATYASGHALSLTYASGLTPNIATNTAIANYASGQSLSLTHASGLTATNAGNITTVTATANYASGQALSLATASGVANYASGQALSLSHASGVTTSLINSSGVATYASGQALSLANASGIATYASGVVTGGNINVGEYIYHAGDSDTYLQFADDDIKIQVGGISMLDFTEGGTDTITFNEAAENIDIRIEGEVDANLFCTDASTNNVGIGTNAPASKLHIRDPTNPPEIRFEDAGGGTQTAKIVFDQAGQNSLVLSTQFQSSSDLNLIQFAPANNVAMTLRGGTGSSNGLVGIGTTAPAYGLDLVGAGANGLIQSSGILIGPSGIGVGTTTPVHPIDVVQHSGVVRASGMHSAISMNADAATVTFDLDQATTHGVTLGGGRTLALSNVQIGDKFLIRLQQDATGSRTVTWFDHISWAGGSAPTLTTTANKADLFGFLTASGTGGAYWFDGLVVGQNI